MIKLENGLTALLIADLHSFCTEDDECADKGKGNECTQRMYNFIVSRERTSCTDFSLIFFSVLA